MHNALGHQSYKGTYTRTSAICYKCFHFTQFVKPKIPRFLTSERAFPPADLLGSSI